jgi:hypothetical protein
MLRTILFGLALATAGLGDDPGLSRRSASLRPHASPVSSGPAGLSTEAGQMKAQIPANVGNDWEKGIQPIGQENYYKAIDCGKAGGENPGCLFYDAGFCKNDDFVLTLYTPYKYVALQVWNAVRQKKEAPTPNYLTAQRTPLTLGISPVKGSKNQIATVVVKRGGKTIEPRSRSIDGSNASFTFDFAAWAPTSDITIEMVGKAGTKTCLVPRVVLARFR